MKKASLYLFMVIAISQCNRAYYNKNFVLVWSDDFEGNKIDTLKWNYDTGAGGWGNEELENYTSSPLNATVDKGNLLIIANKDSSVFTSGRLKTLYRQSWKYGKMEARIKLPSAQGLWPAFWMLGDNIDDEGFPKCGEIDIMERNNSSPTIYGTMHWLKDRHHIGSNGGTKDVNKMKRYHIYAVVWDSLFIRWYIDGKQYWKADVKTIENPTRAFHHNYFILLNLAIGGSMPGNPDKSSLFPDTMFVDWVRVYQLKMKNEK